MDKIIVIGDADTVTGFRLAGVLEALPADQSNADELVSAAIARPDVGILIITQDVLSSLSSKTSKQIETLAKPVVIDVPGKRDASKPSESIAQRVKKAIGVELK